MAKEPLNKFEAIDDGLMKASAVLDRITVTNANAGGKLLRISVGNTPVFECELLPEEALHLASLLCRQTSGFR